MIMNEATKARMSLAYNVVETVILLMSIGLVSWCCIQVIEHGKSLARDDTRIGMNSARLDTLETKGSVGLLTHAKEDDSRVGEIKARLDKLESAVIALQSAPGELKAISARLDSLREGQARIERMFEDHVKANGKP